MKIDLAGVNWLAVGAAAVATFFLGAIWYQALFGKLWTRLNGYTPEKIKEMQAKRPPAMFFGGMLVAYFVLALVVALLVGAMDTRGWQAGAVLGVLLWVGPALAVAFTAWLASEKHFGIFVIDAAYQLVFLVMMGAVVAQWR